MFLGYQENNGNLFISHVADTQEDLENMPCVSFVKIEETDKKYFLHNGQYVYEVSVDQQKLEAQEARATLYAQEVDPLMAEYNRKKTFSLFEEGEEEVLKTQIEAKVAEIKKNNPYPTTGE